MRLEIRAIGRIKAGPERELVDTYIKRADQAGRALALGPVSEREFDPRTLKTKTAETEVLTGSIEPASLVVGLDETGRNVSSLEFSQLIARARDEGCRQVVFLIGGADGHDRTRLPAQTRLISFGTVTWPHKLVRAMLAEQIYRAVSVLAGLPYHREG